MEVFFLTRRIVMKNYSVWIKRWNVCVSHTIAIDFIPFFHGFVACPLKNLSILIYHLNHAVSYIQQRREFPGLTTKGGG